MSSRLQSLLDRGVRVIEPQTIHIADDVDLSRIAPGAILHPGCRIVGAMTSIGPGCVLGEEAPLTLRDSQLGSAVELKGGSVEGAVFLDGASMGSGAHVRPGTIMEEQAGGAHAVGLKQTIFLPFVTAGSLINFCDALMGGGTSRKNHSEIGSSYIHFNFTPHQDKATPSLIGDVPRGVMLDQPPVFLGGQGGLVGPARIGFGCVIPAGTVYRRDAPESGLLLHSPPAAGRGAEPYRMGVYRNAARILRNNLLYIGNIRALRAWYADVRSCFATDPFAKACIAGGIAQLDAVLAERRKRLDEWLKKLAVSAKILASDSAPATAAEAATQRRIVERASAITESLDACAAGTDARRDTLIGSVSAAGAGYLSWVQSLPAETRRAGTAWLQGIVDQTAAAAGEESSHG